MKQATNSNPSKIENKSVMSSGIGFGLLTAVALVAYFLIMSLFNLHHIVELRFLNGVIVTIGICWAIYKFKEQNNGYIRYLDGLGLGFTTAAVAAVLFAIFMVLYVTVINDAFLATLRARQFFGEGLSVIVVFAVIILEGVISGFMVAFIAMQYFKSEKRSHTSYQSENMPVDR
jgi:hypothetical protein